MNNLTLSLKLQALNQLTKPLKQMQGSLKKTSEQIIKAKDSLNKLNRTQGDISAFKKQRDAIKQTSDAHKKAKAHMNKLRVEVEKGGKNALTYGHRYNKAQQEVAKLNSRLKDQGETLKKHKARLSSSGIDVRKLGTHEKQLTDNITKQDAALKKLYQSRKKLNAAERRAANIKQSLGNIQRKGAITAGVGAGTTYAGVRAGQGLLSLMAPGREFGAQMSELQAVARLSKDSPEMAALRQQAQDLGGSTAFKASEVGSAQTFLARAGFSPKAIQNSIGDMLNLALASGTDLAQTADIASNISGAFKIDPEVAGNMARVSDLLAGTAARANVDVVMLGDTMKYLGQAEGLNVTMEQSAALAGLLGNIGIQGSMAGTTMRAMLNRLAAPTSKARAAMEQLNLSVADSDGNLRQVPDILADIAKASKNMGTAERATMLKEIFGTEAGSGMAELIAQQGTGGVQKMLKELQNVQGEAAQMAKTRADNWDGDIKGMASAWEAIGISMQNTNDGPLRQLTQQFTDFLRQVNTFIKDNPEQVATYLKWAAAIAGVLVVGGALLSLLGTSMMFFGGAAKGIMGIVKVTKFLVPAIWSVGKAFLGMMMANPILLAIVAAVALLAGAAYLIYDNWDAIKDYFKNLWGEAKAAWDGGFLKFVGFISKVILNFSPVGLFYKAFAAVMKYFDVDLPTDLSEAGYNVIMGLWEGMKKAIPNIGKGIKKLGSMIVGIFKDDQQIKSPSRLWASMGEDTLAGYQKGLDGNTRQTLNKVKRLGKQVTAAGAGMVLSGAITADTRPPLTGASARANQSESITINIYPQAGQQATDIAQEVERILNQRARQQSLRQGSQLRD